MGKGRMGGDKGKKKMEQTICNASFLKAWKPPYYILQMNSVDGMLL